MERPIFTKFGEVMRLGHLATVSQWNFVNSAAILKNRKILISPQPIDRFGRNVACWCVLTLSAPIANKISLFQKSKMAATAILKVRKIAIYPQQDDRFWRHLARWWVCAFQTLPVKFHKFENSRWRRPPLWTRGSAIAEGLRDELVSRNSENTVQNITFEN